jgi:integrase
VGKRIRLTESAIEHLESSLKAAGRDLGKVIEVWDAKVTGLVLRRQASGSKTWYLRIHVAGRRSNVRLGDWPSLSAEEARKAAAVAAAKVAKGGDPVADRQAQRTAAKANYAKAKRDAAAVLGTFIDGEYKAWADKNLRGHKETLAALKRNFDGWWTRPMDGIGPLDAERWRRNRLKNGVSKATVNREWGRLRATLGKAHEWGVINAPVRVKRLTLDARGRVRYLTTKERTALFAALDAREQRRREERARMIEWQRARGREELAEHGTYTDHIKPLVLLVLNTGLRRGEALGLTWGAIDLARGLLHINAATSKSGQSRDIPMTADARRVLEEWKEQQAQPEPTEHVFTLADGSRLKSIGRKTWLELMKAASITNFRFHDLRHDFASRLVMAGVDLYSVSKLLGHSDIAMTQRYAHLTPDYLRAAVSKLDGGARPAVDLVESQTQAL